MRYSIPARIAHETLDNEVVLLDQDSGSYFSLTGGGAAIWAQVVRGADDDQIVGYCEASFDGPQSISDDVRAVLARLVQEALVAPVAGPGAGVLQAHGRAPWVSPRLDRFDDLQSLLTLDPIHDVDESGWPRTP